MNQSNDMDLPKGVTNNIREVFGYIQRFKEKVFVLKLDDDLLDSPLFSVLVKDIVHIKNMGIKVVLVLGAHNSINKVLETYGVATDFEDRIRITSQEALPLVKLGASNVSNEVLTLLSENGASGVLGNWIKAREVGVLQGKDYQNTGKVDSINLSVVNKLLEEGLVPILTNIGWSSTGKPYNISSNDVAVSLAGAIQAAKLFFIGTKPGINSIEDCQVKKLEIRETGVFSALELSQAEELLEKHGEHFDFKDRELIEHALRACHSGVNRIHIIDGSQDGILLQEIFSTKGHGTMFHANLYSNIRLAIAEDIPEILHIMQSYVERGVLIQRTTEDIAKKLGSYYVYEVDDAIHGCCALTLYSDGSAEIEAVVVNVDFSGKGTGAKMISYLVEKSKKENMHQVFILTTQSKDYFMRLGFENAKRDSLPLEKRNEYNEGRKSKVMSLML